MIITLSAAVTADGCLDDTTPERLVISGPEDWAEVYRLRAACDAILIGACTLRSDNPSLRLKEPSLIEQRMEAGLPPEPMKVVVTRSGRLDPASKFFTTGQGEKIVLAAPGAGRAALKRLEACATVVSVPGSDVTAIVQALERLGIRRLLVEGGARVLDMFLRAGMADEFRLAVAPWYLGDDRAPRLSGSGLMLYDGFLRTARIRSRRRVGELEVTWWNLYRDGNGHTCFDRECLAQAIDESRKCTPSCSAYSVGCVIVTRSGNLYTGYTHETGPAEHAEEVALAKALAAGDPLAGATAYTSMEPCSTRMSKPVSCSALLIRHGFAWVVYAYAEPDCFVRCCGTALLREAGIEVDVLPAFAQEVVSINSHIIK